MSKFPFAMTCHSHEQLSRIKSAARMRSHRNEYMVVIFDTSDFSTQRDVLVQPRVKRKGIYMQSTLTYMCAADVLLLPCGGNL